MDNNGLWGNCAWEVKTPQDLVYADTACAVVEYRCFHFSAWQHCYLRFVRYIQSSDRPKFVGHRMAVSHFATRSLWYSSFCCALRAPKNTIKLKRRNKGEKGANEKGLYNREKGNERSELRQMMHRNPSSTDAAVVAVLYKAICQAQAI